MRLALEPLRTAAPLEEAESLSQWRRFNQTLTDNRDCWQPGAWTAFQDAEGFAGSVIFPPPNEVPFGTSADPELNAAGAAIWNRWLADFCEDCHGRVAGIACLPYFTNPQRVAQEVRVISRHGPRGGLVLPPMKIGQHGYQSEIYDPVWAAAQDAGLALVNHTLFSVGQGFCGGGPEWIDQAIAMYDARYFDRRHLWYMILGGVFDRFTSLKLSFAEHRAGWVPDELRNLGLGRSWANLQKRGLKLTPYEYWYKHCYITPSAISKSEIEARHVIGVDNLVWGSDFPHPEGTHPFTREHLRYIFAEIPHPERERILGANAASLYGFDWPVLEVAAARIGPSRAELESAYVPGEDALGYRPVAFA
jgi:predicted TIM-barrel fold metal-dependent hydrolase